MIVIPNGTMSRQQRHEPLRIDPDGVLRWTLAQAHAGDLDRGKLGGRLGPVAVEHVKIGIRAWGFQIRGFSGKLDGPGVAEVQRDEKDAI